MSTGYRVKVGAGPDEYLVVEFGDQRLVLEPGAYVDWWVPRDQDVTVLKHVDGLYQAPPPKERKT